MIKRLPAMAMVLLSVLLGLALPQPAVAQEPWNTYPCPSGVLDAEAVTFELAGPDAIRVELPGSLPCSAGSKYRFAVATFTPGDATALIYDGMLGPYNPIDTTYFVAAVGMSKRQQLGVCLMSDPTTRLSCVLITVDPLGWTSAVTLDPARIGVVGELSALRPTPECNACWVIR